MADRINIVLYDAEDRSFGWQRGAILYQHWGEVPAVTGPMLETMLESAATAINSKQWGSKPVSEFLLERIGSFEKTHQVHSDICFLWRLMIGPEHGDFEIQCFNVIFDWRIDEPMHMKEVDWRKEAEEHVSPQQ